MDINNEHNYTIDYMTDDEIYKESVKAKYKIIELYNENKLGDPDVDFKYGACGILAGMLYNIYPGKAKVYLSNDHAIVQIGSKFQDIDSLNTNETLEKIGTGIFYPLDLRVESDRDRFYCFLDRCKIQSTGEYGKKIKEIEEQVKEEMGYEYETKVRTKAL